MNVLPAAGLLVAIAASVGMALWSAPVAAAAATTAAAPTAAAERSPAPALAGGEGDLGRTVLALLPDALRARAVVGAVPSPAVMLARSVPRSALAAGDGVLTAELAPLPRALLATLLAHAFATVPGAPRGCPRLDELAFAWAGERRCGAPFYLRLHGEDCAVEWCAAADGLVHAAWREFARDRGQPWLRDLVFGSATR